MRAFVLPFGLALVALSSVAYSAEGEQGSASQPQSVLESRAQSILQASPEQILRARKQIQDFSAAKQAPIAGDFEPGIPQDILDLEDIFDLTLEPDQVAPKVFISRYQSTAISFVDAYGNPWPIRKISNFLSGMILIEQAVPKNESSSGGDDKDKKESAGGGLDINDPQAGSFTMTALKHGVVGNITVYLEKLATPITLVVVGKPSMFHRLATMRVNDIGPQTDASQLFQDNGVVVGTEADVDLNNALYGVSPQGSESMAVEGADGKAWLKGDYLYLQTPISVFSPEILRASPGNGKYKAYKLPKTTRVLGVNTEGRTVTMKIMRHPATAIEEANTLPKGRK